MKFKTLGKAVVGAIGSGLAFAASELRMAPAWKGLVVAVLILGSSYGIWKTPYVPAPELTREDSSIPNVRQ